MQQQTEMQDIHQVTLLPSITDLPLSLSQSQFFELKSEEIRQLLFPSQKEERSIPPPLVSKGFWSPHEDELLIKAVSETNPILWDCVAQKVPGRSGRLQAEKGTGRAG